MADCMGAAGPVRPEPLPTGRIQEIVFGRSIPARLTKPVLWALYQYGSAVSRQPVVSVFIVFGTDGADATRAARAFLQAAGLTARR